MSFTLTNSFAESYDCRAENHEINRSYVLETSIDGDVFLNGNRISSQNLDQGLMGNQSFVIQIKQSSDQELAFIVNRRTPMNSELLIRKMVSRPTCWDGCDNVLYGMETVGKLKATCRAGAF
jgi:hypothetical protein